MIFHDTVSQGMHEVIQAQENEKNERRVIALFREQHGVLESQELPQDTLLVLKKLAKLRPDIEQIALRPIELNEPSHEETQLWREQFSKIFRNTDEGLQAADTILEKTERIPQDFFEAQLMKSFLAMEADLQDVTPEECAVIWYGSGVKSNNWVQDIARDYKPDSKVFQLDTINYYDLMYGSRKDETPVQKKVGVIFDDASYSGFQIKGIITSGITNSGMEKFIIAVPFLTEKAVQEIEAVGTEYGVEIIFRSQQKMLSVKEKIGDEAFKVLQVLSSDRQVHEGQTLTYFAHKVPDERSFLPFLSHTRTVEYDRRISNLLTGNKAIYH